MREHLKELRDKMEDVRKSAEDYWLPADAKGAAQGAVSLKAELQRLAGVAGALQKLGLEFEASPLLVELRKHATGGDFEKRGRRKNQRADAERLTDIAGALEDVLTAAEEAFYRRFKPIRPMHFWKRAPVAFLLLLGADRPA